MAAKSPDAQISETQVISAVKIILQFIGDDPEREGLLKTPLRMIESWKKIFGGYAQNPENVLQVSFGEFGKYDQMILLKDIDFYSVCEHHFLPIIGTVAIAYIPKDRVVGISKLARLVEIYARRLQIQERLTADIGHSIENILEPEGVGVLIKARHLCISSRGVEKQNSEMITSYLGGVFREVSVRQEFFNLIGG